MVKDQVVVVVDPFSSGRYMVQEFRRQGWSLVGVISSSDIDDGVLSQYIPENFVKTVNHLSIGATLEELMEFEVVNCVAGCECGVVLANELQHALSLPCNDVSTKEWRRNKYAQQEQIRSCGLRAIRQIISNDVDEIMEFQSEWGRWPIILKPAESTGTDGVFCCHDVDDVRNAYNETFGKFNRAGAMNDFLLAQEYLDGTEYAIDCMSYNGQHVNNAIWEEDRTRESSSKRIPWNFNKLLPGQGELADKLLDYVYKVLDACGVRHGPSHTEVKIVNGEVCLVEFANRLIGSKGPLLHKQATGLGGHELAVDIAVNGGELFKQYHASGGRYNVENWVIEVALKSDKEGILVESIDQPELRNLASFWDISPAVSVGDKLEVTVDLFSLPGIVLLSHASFEQCWEDYQKVRHLESTTLYKTRPLDTDFVDALQ